MANKFASGKNAIAECDRCGFQYKLKQLKELTIKTVTLDQIIAMNSQEIYNGVGTQ
jgi:hypothetical protein